MSDCTVSLVTELGVVGISLHVQAAPHTCSYFLGDVDRGVFDRSTIFRIVTLRHAPPPGRPAIEVMQGGSPPIDMNIKPSIRHESTNLTGLRHRRGTISLARFSPGAAYHSFFVCFRDEPSLDFGGDRQPDGQGFAAFGDTLYGWDVLDKLRQCAEPDEMLCKPLQLRVARVAPG